VSDVHVPSGATMKVGRVEGELKVGNNARIQSADGEVVIVTEGAEFYGNATVDCDLKCQNLKVNRSGRLRVTGNLTVGGPIDVSNSIVVEKTMKADSVDVGGRVNAQSIQCKRMRVGGTAEISGLLQADSVDVGGKIEATGSLDVKDLQVGGKAVVGGGKISGTINVGGKFESSSKLEFGELQIFGTGSLYAGSRGRKVVASGKLEARGDLRCDQMEVYGVTSISGDCNAVRIDVKGKLDVTGSLTATEKLEIHGSTEVGRVFQGGRLQISGSFSAEKAIAAGDVEVHGAARTVKGLKATSIFVRSGSRCAGPIVAETVEVGGSGPGMSAFVWGQRLRIQAGTSQVEDVYASRFVLGPGSKAKRVFGRVIELGSGCDVDEIAYVDEIKMAEHVTIAHPVRKVDNLGEPPL
jgi:cytoskeletal protein CcmA (bactofilin family)